MTWVNSAAAEEVQVMALAFLLKATCHRRSIADQLFTNRLIDVT